MSIISRELGEEHVQERRVNGQYKKRESLAIRKTWNEVETLIVNRKGWEVFINDLLFQKER